MAGLEPLTFDLGKTSFRGCPLLIDRQDARCLSGVITIRVFLFSRLEPPPPAHRLIGAGDAFRSTVVYLLLHIVIFILRRIGKNEASFLFVSVGCPAPPNGPPLV